MTEDEEIIEHPIESSFDISKTYEVKHHWVKRGIKISCEGGNHPHHSHFLVNKRNSNG